MSNYYIVPADSSLTPKRLLRSEQTTIYIIPVLSFVVSGLTVILYINKKEKVDQGHTHPFLNGQVLSEVSDDCAMDGNYCIPCAILQDNILF